MIAIKTKKEKHVRNMRNNQIVVEGETFTEENVKRLLLLVDEQHNAIIRLRKENNELEEVIAKMGAF